MFTRETSPAQNSQQALSNLSNFVDGLRQEGYQNARFAIDSGDPSGSHSSSSKLTTTITAQRPDGRDVRFTGSGDNLSEDGLVQSVNLLQEELSRELEPAT